MHGQYNATKYQEITIWSAATGETNDKQACRGGTAHAWGGASCVFPKRKNFYLLSTSMRIASCSFK